MRTIDLRQVLLVFDQLAAAQRAFLLCRDQAERVHAVANMKQLLDMLLAVETRPEVLSGALSHRDPG